MDFNNLPFCLYIHLLQMQIEIPELYLNSDLSIIIIFKYTI